MSWKGVTPVVAVVLLMTVTVAATGTVYTLFIDTQEQLEENAPDIDLDADILYIESCWTDGGETSLAIRNTATETVSVEELDILVEGQEESFSVDETTTGDLVDPQHTFHVNFNDDFSNGEEIMIFTHDSELIHRCR